MFSSTARKARRMFLAALKSRLRVFDPSLQCVHRRNSLYILDFFAIDCLVDIFHVMETFVTSFLFFDTPKPPLCDLAFCAA